MSRHITTHSMYLPVCVSPPGFREQGKSPFQKLRLQIKLLPCLIQKVWIQKQPWVWSILSHLFHRCRTWGRVRIEWISWGHAAISHHCWCPGLLQDPQERVHQPQDAVLPTRSDSSLQGNDSARGAESAARGMRCSVLRCLLWSELETSYLNSQHFCSLASVYHTFRQFQQYSEDGF